MKRSEVLQWYQERDMDLIVLHGVHGKRPRDPGWNQKIYSESEIWDHFIAKGLNIGYRIGDHFAVIDVDPRNGGDSSLTRLMYNIGYSFSGDFTVKTGSGGKHIYLKLPENTGNLREVIQEYPGIELKIKGRQVVIPGSIHPKTKKEYEFQCDPNTTEIRQAPEELLKLYTVEYKTTPVSEDETIEPHELAEILSQLPAEEYDTNDKWFPILAASYHATGGLGIYEFLEWCTSDPRYQDDSEIIKLRWFSLKRPQGAARSVGTLYRELGKHGKSVKNTKTYKEMFEEEPGELSYDTTAVEVGQLVKNHVANGASNVELIDLSERIASRTKFTKTTIMQQILPAMRRELKVAESPKEKKTPSPQKLDSSMAITDLVIDKYGKDNIIHAADQSFWVYGGTFWLRCPDNLIQKKTLESIEEFKVGYPEKKVDPSSMIHKVQILLKAKLASRKELFGANTELPSVVNCANYEVWVDQRTGEYTPGPHTPEHYLTSCLPIEYKPDARCPRFESFLREVFEPLPDRDSVIRHVWEIMGYTLQPNKDIPGWFLLHGKGQNGKTVFLRVLGALMGSSALFQSISSFDTTKNTFAFADLVGRLALIDDDVRAGQILPDDFIKKVAENKTLQANPKYGQPFQFKSCATVFLAANSWPQSRDLSLGMRRRVNVIPFKRQFSVDEIEPALGQYLITTELSGVLNMALAGLQRLRCRGRFVYPKSCLDAVDSWTTNANQSQQFMEEYFTKDLDSYEFYSDVWARYQEYCIAAGIKRTYSRRGLGTAIADLGYMVKKDGNRFKVFGVKGIDISERVS